MPHHFAQVNVARAVAPLDSPVMADFMAALDHVNAAADVAPGFVWRLQDDSGNATSVPFLGDDRMIVNLSVWRSMADLEAYMYSAPHQPILRRRREWFEPLGKPATACWWVPAGHLPDVGEAATMLTRLWVEGSSDVVFALGRGVPPAPPS